MIQLLRLYFLFISSAVSRATREHDHRWHPADCKNGGRNSHWCHGFDAAGEEAQVDGSTEEEARRRPRDRQHPLSSEEPSGQLDPWFESGRRHRGRGLGVHRCQLDRAGLAFGAFGATVSVPFSAVGTAGPSTIVASTIVASTSSGIAAGNSSCIAGIVGHATVGACTEEGVLFG